MSNKNTIFYFKGVKKVPRLKTKALKYIKTKSRVKVPATQQQNTYTPQHIHNSTRRNDGTSV